MLPPSALSMIAVKAQAHRHHRASSCTLYQAGTGVPAAPGTPAVASELAPGAVFTAVGVGIAWFDGRPSRDVTPQRRLGDPYQPIRRAITAATA